MVRLIVEPIQQMYACCDALITAADVASAVRFQNERRRAEHLAWRRVVRRELGRTVTIDYNAVGAPTVDTPNTYISVAHGGGMVAVAIAEQRVGVDIESGERNFERAKERYMSAEELRLSDDSLWPAMAWTAKEAMYKLYGEKGVDLRDDLRIVAFDAATRCITGELDGQGTALVNISITEDNMVVAVATFEHN